MISKSELMSEVYNWRFKDLGGIERSLDAAYSSVQKIKDSETADDFLSALGATRDEVKKMFDEMDKVLKKVREMKSEMEKKEESAK